MIRKHLAANNVLRAAPNCDREKGDIVLSDGKRPTVSEMDKRILGDVMLTYSRHFNSLVKKVFPPCGERDYLLYELYNRPGPFALPEVPQSTIPSLEKS